MEEKNAREVTAREDAEAKSSLLIQLQTLKAKSAAREVAAREEEAISRAEDATSSASLLLQLQAMEEKSAAREVAARKEAAKATMEVKSAVQLEEAAAGLEDETTTYIKDAKSSSAALLLQLQTMEVAARKDALLARLQMAITMRPDHYDKFTFYVRNDRSTISMQQTKEHFVSNWYDLASVSILRILKSFIKGEGLIVVGYCSDYDPANSVDVIVPSKIPSDSAAFKEAAAKAVTLFHAKLIDYIYGLVGNKPTVELQADNSYRIFMRT